MTRVSSCHHKFSIPPISGILAFAVSFLLFSIITSTYPVLSVASSLVSVAPDPEQYGIGFARAHTDKRGNILVFFGNSHNSFGNNSVRSFNPVTNTWAVLWPNDPHNGGLQNRDNYSSLYNPARDELWVWGGSGLENFDQPALRSGRFSLAKNTWVATSTTNSGAFVGIVRDGMPFFPNAAMAWSESANIGLVFGGSREGNPTNFQYIIESNPAGPEPYKVTEYLGTKPPERAQSQNLMVAVGSDFYVYGGLGVDWKAGQYIYLKDLWKFSGANRAWTRLADAPVAGYVSVLTYDTQLNTLVAWVNAKLYVYDIVTNQWADGTPIGLPCVFNQVAAYSPSGKFHFYEGGNDCATGNSTYMSLGITISGVAPPPPPPADTMAPSVSIGVPSNGATVSGTITVSANASDNVGVAGVQFKLDGTNLGAETTVVPYSTSWNSNLVSNGSHTLTAVARDAAGNTATSAAVTVTVSNIGLPSTPGWLNLPLRTWVSRPVPPPSSDVRTQFLGQRGFGPSPKDTGAKHQRLVYIPDTNRVYFYSGDFSGPPAQSSFRTDMFSYDIAKSVSSDASDYQNWILEWPYCGFSGQVSPMHTDEAPFTWDSKRKVFWAMGGFESSTDNAVAMCNNGALFYGSSAATPGNTLGNAYHGPDILQFDPAQRKFVRPDPKYKLPGDAVAQDGTPLLGGAQTPRHAVYNPVTDEIIMMGQHGGWGNYVIRMNAETGVWTRDGGGIGGNLSSDAIDGSYINDTHATHEQLALDELNQFIYWIDTYHKQAPDPNRRFRLMRYDITTHKMASMGWITLPNYGDPTKFPFYAAPYDSTLLAYDSINRVVLWPASSNEGRPILMIYHPDPTGGKNGWWETDPMNRDKPNEIVFGSNGTFIPDLNALIIYGGFGTPNSDFFSSACPTCKAPQNYFWLYRYGLGSGTASTPPAAPTQLRIF
jgi:hypothetical protein